MGKTIAEDKMAAVKTSMAEELLNAITEPFTKVVCKLHDSRIVSVENFKIKKAELMKSHWIDGTLLLTSDKKKPTTTGIFEVFANKAGLNATELKEMLIDWMCDKRTELGNCMAIALNQSTLSFTEWLQKITLSEAFIPDDLTIYCLSRFLNIHTVVYTKDFCWSTLLQQFKMSEEELYAKSDIKLIYVGRDMYVELKHIRQPKPQPPKVITSGNDQSNQKNIKKNTKPRKSKVTNRGDKICTKPSKNQRLPPPPEPRHSERKRRKIDYLQLNDGLEEPGATPDKPKHPKPNSPPPRQGPSASRQAASKRKRDKQGKPAHLHLQLEIDKLPDLVVNVKKLSEVNIVTSKSSTPTSATKGVPVLTGVTNTSETDPHSQNTNLVTPEKTNTSAPNNTSLTLPVGHDTATTTDEEEAAEALLALGSVPDYDDFMDEEDNATLMPVGKPSTTLDVNPVPVKLSAKDVSVAIHNMPDENKLKPTPSASTDLSPAPSADTVTEVPEDGENSTPTNTVGGTSSKGQLKVKNYGLRKPKQSKNRTYKCQKCGKTEKSAHDLNEHHRNKHPPLLCTVCNKVFNVPSTFQMHQYEHQKRKKIACETCGQLFTFQGQLDQHKIVHRSIRTHKCMHKGCERWFMRNADLVVHAESHKNVKYKCDICNSFTTKVKKYWKEHIRNHENKLRYSCPTCGEKFQYRQQVSRHKANEHK